MLHVTRSPRAEALADRLAATLERTWPEDVLADVTIAVGSRGMERWLRDELATRHGIAAGLAFPFPRQALRSRVHSDQHTADAWAPEALRWHVLDLLEDADFSARLVGIDDWLAASPTEAISGVVDARRLELASALADGVDRLLQHRRRQLGAMRAAHAAITDDRDALPAGLDRALTLLAALEDRLGQTHHAAALDRLAVADNDDAAHSEPLHIFGVSSLGPAELQVLALLARTMDVYVYALTPTLGGWPDMTAAAAGAASRWLGAEGRAAIVDVERGWVSQALHPLLRALGGPSRVLDATLVQLASTGDVAITVEDVAGTQIPPSDHLLSRLQADIVAATAPGVGPDAQREPLRPDGSVSVHACIGPTRQVEVLRELVQGWLDTGRTRDGRRLEPRDVLIMTPDIETYAPLVDAAFRAPRGGVSADGEAVALPSIPVHIADLGLRQTNGVADALGRLIAMARGRVTLPQVAGLLSLPVVRTCFGLDAVSTQRAITLLADAGARWGRDRQDRAALLGRPDEPRPFDGQFSLSAAVDRLVFGALIPGDDPPDALLPEPMTPTPSTASTLPLAQPTLPLAPLSALGDDDVQLVGALAAFEAALTDTLQALSAGPRPWHDWRDLLDGAIAALTSTEGPTAWLEADVREALDGLAPDDCELTLDAIDALLAGRFDVPQRGDRPVTGAVTMCALEPMRSVPFEVVVLLGLDEELYPRKTVARGHDPLVGRERVGDPDRSAVDRHLLLEALLSARSQLAILYGGRDPHRGEALPVALPVLALLEALAARCGVSDPDTLIEEHPLQPWSPAAFAPERGAARSFDRALAVPSEPAPKQMTAWYANAGYGDVPTRVDPGTDEAATQSPPTPARWTTEALATRLVSPARHLRRERVGLRPRRALDALDEREALELDGLSAWQLVEETLQRDSAQHAGSALDVDRTLARHIADGRVPATSAALTDARGRLHIGAQIATACTQLPAAPEPRVAPLRLQVPAELDANASWLPTSPEVPLWHHTREVWLEPDAGLRRVQLDEARTALIVPSSRPRGRDLPLLRAWLGLCLAQAREPADTAPVGAVIVGTATTKRGGEKVIEAAALGLRAPGRDEALATLRTCAQLGLLIDSLAVPLFERVSLGLAIRRRDDAKDLEKLLSVGTPQSKWQGLPFQGIPGVRDDEDVAAVFDVAALEEHGVGHKDPDAWPAGLRELADMLWSALLDRVFEVPVDGLASGDWPTRDADHSVDAGGGR